MLKISNKNMNKELTIFQNDRFGQVRTTLIDGEVWLVGKDVAEALGYQNPSKALSDHVDSDDKLNNESLSSLGQRGGWLINESGLYSLVLSSKLPQTREFKRWVTKEVIPSIRKTGTYTLETSKNDVTKNLVDASVAWIEGVKRLLSLNDSSTLLLLKQCGERYGLPTPDYVDSKGSLHSATELLKRNGLSLSARAFNRIALSCGYLQTKTRPSRKGSKEYRNLTEKVLRYGENQVNPNNPKETQPLYYDTTFMELCKELEIA